MVVVVMLEGGLLEVEQDGGDVVQREGAHEALGDSVVDRAGRAVGLGVLHRVFDVEFEEVEQVEVLVENGDLGERGGPTRWLAGKASMTWWAARKSRRMA